MPGGGGVVFLQFVGKILFKGMLVCPVGLYHLYLSGTQVARDYMDKDGVYHYWQRMEGSNIPRGLWKLQYYFSSVIGMSLLPFVVMDMLPYANFFVVPWFVQISLGLAYSMACGVHFGLRPWDNRITVDVLREHGEMTERGIVVDTNRIWS